MARTPLFRLLARTLQEARREEAGLEGGHPAGLHAPGGGAEGAALTAAGHGLLLPPPPSSRRPLSRRHFLRRSGGAMAAATLGASAFPGLFLGGCTPGDGPGGNGRGQGGGSDSGGPSATGSGEPRQPGPDDPHLVIVGAGVAGLTAGWRLHQAGLPLRILEAQERVGGRMYSIRDHFPDGQVAELGGELIDTGHVHLRALVRELGLELDDLHAIETAEPELWHFRGRTITEAELVSAWGPVAARVEADLAALALPDDWPWITWDAPAGAETLDRLSLAAWLADTEMEGWFREVLDLGFTSQFGREADEQSALNLHTLIDPDPGVFDIYGESDERFHIRGGNDQVPRELGRRLAPVIELGTRLESVRQGPDGRYVLSVRQGAASREIRADHVVLALPFTLLREVELDVELPAVKRRAIAELGYGRNAKLMMGFSGRPWRDPHGYAGTVVSDLPFQVTWETSRAQGGASGILTNFTGGRAADRVGEGDTEARAREIVAALETLFPGTQAAHDPALAVRFHWPTHPWTRGSYACYLPGQWTTLAGAEGMPVGRLHFAGEHTSLDAQGYMEGGCESGDRVAAEVLAALGRAARAA